MSLVWKGGNPLVDAGALIWVVVPSYWTAPGVVGAFDHPTPFDGQSTLPRLLESLARQDGPSFKVLLLAGATRENLLPQAESALRQRAGPFQGQLDLLLLGERGLHGLRQHINLASEAFNLLSYAGIRNLQLLIPFLLGAQIVIALDDDEVVAPDYIARAVQRMREGAPEGPLRGLSGPYADAQGNLLLEEPQLSGNIFRDKAHFINRALASLIGAKQEVVPTALAFGGNMIFDRRVIERVGFDPGITRGEDMDYLINARIEGITWWMAPRLTITHLPPRHYEAPESDKLGKDIIRFFYERAKIERFGLPAQDFDPYPGRFFRADLDEHALQALEEEGNEELFKRFGRPEVILQLARERAEANLSRYAAFRRRWQQDMAQWAGDQALGRRIALELEMG
jgi:hypothetical protein